MTAMILDLTCRTVTQATMPDSKPLKVTYYLDVLSSWCFWAEPAWADLRAEYGEDVEFDWAIAQLDLPAFPPTREACDWFYRRSGTVVGSPFMLSSRWMEGGGDVSVPNRVAVAARHLGAAGDTVRLALARAALVHGRPMRILEEAVAVACEVYELDKEPLATAADSETVREEIRQSSERFASFQIDQRPSFVLEDEIGDRAILSGLISVEALQAVLEGMLSDVDAYRSYAAHFGAPPA
jgi:predicted DsbA family dithiol-disulfide isomerase